MRFRSKGDLAATPPGADSGGFLRRLIGTTTLRHRGRLIGATIGLVFVVGLIDYVTGFEISFLFFYFVPVCLAVIGIGWRFGLTTAVVSVATWLVGDYAAGARYASVFVPIWNAVIALGTYSVVVWLLTSLLAMHREMEERVRQRTAALTEEIAERERLEKVVLEISERERRSIGHDLHDGLGQHLTGIALIGKAMVSRMQEGQVIATADVERIVTLVEDGIEQTRSLAKGLLLAEIEPDGLVAALRELAVAAREQFGVACEFCLKGSISLDESGTATHLYRIAQEAVRNAIRHGRARHVRILLSVQAGELELRVDDDGAGISPPGSRASGLGLRIMAHRAAMIGGTFAVEPQLERGTSVVCRMRRRG